MKGHELAGFIHVRQEPYDAILGLGMWDANKTCSNQLVGKQDNKKSFWT